MDISHRARQRDVLGAGHVQIRDLYMPARYVTIQAAPSVYASERAADIVRHSGATGRSPVSLTKDMRCVTHSSAVRLPGATLRNTEAHPHGARVLLHVHRPVQDNPGRRKQCRRHRRGQTPDISDRPLRPPQLRQTLPSRRSLATGELSSWCSGTVPGSLGRNDLGTSPGPVPDRLRPPTSAIHIEQ